MSEQQPAPPPPEGQTLSPARPLAEATGELFGSGTPELSDDTPTIISKTPPTPDSAALQNILRGRKLAHYELIEPIGVGGMAAVLRARDTQLDRPVALKILPPEMAADPENIRRFHQEARAAARLDHETIARVFFCGEDQGLHFIAFEYVEGENLRTLLERRGRLPVEEAVHYLLQIATGLAHAAERGVVHRDIKPSNIIITPQGRAKLVDMGLARSLEPRDDGGLTQSGVTLGTFDYISPEQALEPRDADVRSDIYSLGCTFYHLLTGQAPVPEGTAARKLHYHQHVLPLDPRQLNPDIPDEVAAVLARMMAKDPGQRYQHPEQLVMHLIQLTQMLRKGQPAESSGGVLVMDAPLPAPPRTRPLLVGLVSAAIVVVLVVFIGPAPQPLSPGPPLAADHEPGPPPEPPKDKIAQPGVAMGDTPKGPELPPSEAPVEIEVTSLRQLQADLARMPTRGKEVILTVVNDLTLSDEGEPLVLRGRKIVVRARNGETGPRPTLWTEYKGKANTWAGLVIEASDEVQLRGLRVVADATRNAPRLAGVQFRGGAAVSVEGCEFIQGNWLNSSSLSSVSVQAAGAAPRLAFRRCAFLGGRELQHTGPMGGPEAVQLADVAGGGQDAVTVSGAASLLFEDCAFGPHLSLVRFEEAGRKGTVDFHRCTALAGDDWAAVHLDKQASCAVKVAFCLFARAAALPERGMLESRSVACLVRHAEPLAEGQATYEGNHNRYLNLDAVWAWAEDDGTGMAAETFASQLRQQKGVDDKVLPADLRPWKVKNPLATLEQQLDAATLQSAFQLDPAAGDLLKADTQPPQLVGLHRSPWGRLYDLAGVDTARAPRRERIVDPSRKTNSADGVYQTLDEALAGARDGDTITLRKTGELAIVTPISLVTPGMTLTIRAAEGHRPVLVLEAIDRSATSLFRLHDSHLVLEDVELRLRPRQPGFSYQGVATTLGEGSVQLTRCVVTLDGRLAPAVPLAAVVLADPNDAMPQPGGGDKAPPRVAFDTCLVRGDGDLVSAQASRPFELDVRGSLVALTGSLLHVEDQRKSAPAPDQKVPVSLQRVTAYLGGHLFYLRAADLKNLVPLAVDQARSCLFVSAEEKADKALIRVEGPRATEDKVHEKLLWVGERNQYTNYGRMVEWPVSESEARVDMVSHNGWKEFAPRDSDIKAEKVSFAGPLWPKADMARMSRENFKATSMPPDLGANIDLLPTPAAEPRGRSDRE